MARTRRSKIRADLLGNETPLEMNDLVDVGVYAAGGDDTPLFLRKHRIRGDTTIRVVVDRRPARRHRPAAQADRPRAGRQRG